MPGPVLIDSFSHAFSGGALSHDTTVTKSTNDVKLQQVLIHTSAAISETIAVVHVGVEGATTYLVTLDSSTLSSAQNYVFRPTGDCVFKKGDKIRVTCSAATATGTLYGKVQYSEVD